MIRSAAEVVEANSRPKLKVKSHGSLNAVKSPRQPLLLLKAFVIDLSRINVQVAKNRSQCLLILESGG
jgi:hypothetical protein